MMSRLNREETNTEQKHFKEGEGSFGIFNFSATSFMGKILTVRHILQFS